MSDALERIIRVLGDALPGTMVPAAELHQQLVAATSCTADITPTFDHLAIDLTVEQAAEKFRNGKFRCSQSTVRTWCAQGLLPGAYRRRGREWRIPAAAIVEMQRRESERATAERRASATNQTPADLGAWRRHMPRKAS
jgi:hypothetical protein